MAEKVPGAAGRGLVVAAAIALSGCAGSLEQAQYTGVKERQLVGGAKTSASRCELLDDRRMYWGAGAKGSALAAGASGISALPLRDSEEARIGLAVGALGAALASAVAIAIEEGAATSWARECSAR